MPEIELHEATSPGMPGVVFSSVTAAGVSKRASAEWVAMQLGLSLSHCAMVGDGENDLELIQAVASVLPWVTLRIRSSGLPSG